jgi:hypothetical protein
MVAAPSARMNDNPGTGMGRKGKGDTIKEFETVPTVLETCEPLGAIKWGYKIEGKPNAPIQLTGGDPADVTDTPSATWTRSAPMFPSTTSPPRRSGSRSRSTSGSSTSKSEG